MSSETDFSKPTRGRWVRLLGLVILVGLVGFGFTQTSQKMRANHLKSATMVVLQKEAERNPDDLDLLYQLAYKQHRAGDDKEAMVVMQHVIKLEPKAVRAWYGLARCAAGAGYAKEAVEAYKKVLELDPKQVMPRLSIGEVYASAGLVTDALREYDRANNKTEAARFGGDVWADCLIQKGRLEEAWDILMTSLNRSPTQEKAYVTLAELGMRLKRYPETEKWLQRRIQMTSMYPVADIRRALARVLLEQPDTPYSMDTAEFLLRAVVADVGKSGKTNVLLARVYIVRKDWVAAKAELEAGLKKDPDHRESLTVLAEVYDKLRQPEQAARVRERLAAVVAKEESGLPALRKAVEAAPDDADARLRLADALDRAELFGEAAEACEAILAKNPSDTRVSGLRDTYRQKALDKLTKSGAYKQSSADALSAAGP